MPDWLFFMMFSVKAQTESVCLCDLQFSLCYQKSIGKMIKYRSKMCIVKMQKMGRGVRSGGGVGVDVNQELKLL